MPPTEASAAAPPDRRRAPLAFGPFVYDGARGLLRKGDVELSVPPRVLAVLDLLLARAGEIVPKQELIDSVWKQAFVTDTSLAEAVSVLRQALGDDPQAATYIQTIHRRGYRFVAAVAEAGQVRPEAANEPAASKPHGDEASPALGTSLVPWSVALICAVLAAAAVWQSVARREPSPPVVRLRLEPAAGTSFDTRAPALALAPDGSRAAWSGCDRAGCRLYVRPLDALDATVMPGTDGAHAPFFSPDGQSLGFFADGKLKRVALSGGAPISIADAAQPLGATWLPDGQIVFAPSLRGGLMRVSARGGEPVVLTTPAARAGEFGHAWPSALPDGRSLLFTITTAPVDGMPGRVAILSLDGSAPRWQSVVDAGDAARPVTPDYIAFSRGSDLHVVPFDRVRRVTAGPDQVVVTPIAPGQFATSTEGGLVYGTSNSLTAAAMTWFDGAALAGLPAEASAWRQTVLSPDGSRVAGVRTDHPGADLWLADLARGATTRLTHGGLTVAPVWSGDGGTLFYASARGGAFDIWRRDAAGTAPEARVFAEDGTQHRLPAAASADGRVLIFSATGDATRGDIWMATVDGTAPVPLAQSEFDETGAALSPDGTLLAFQSDESGRWEVSLLRLRDKRRLPLSTRGGSTPFWSRDGRSVYYQAQDRLVRVEVAAAGDRASAPVDLGELAGGTPAGIAPDGRMLLRRDGIGPAPHAVLTLEWFRELRARLGPPLGALPR